MINVLENFLTDDVDSQVMYEGLIGFIASDQIRNGEFEGNLFIVKKMSLDIFFIYQEYERPDGKKDFWQLFSISKKNLLISIQSYAEEKGFKLVDIAV